MTLVKVRRDGNSLAITIPVEEARAAQIEEGMYVDIALESLRPGLHVEPMAIRPRGRPEVLSAGRRVLEKNRGLYDRLAAHDRDST